MQIERWRVVETAPGAAARPSDLARDDGFQTNASTLAQALVERGALDPERPRDLDLSDWWWLAQVEGAGEYVLRLNGLATIADVFLDDVPLLSTQNMFRRYHAPVRLEGSARLAIRFRALASILPTFKGRARWRPRAVEDSKIRHVRTTLLGRMPGFAPLRRVVGPWRAVELIPREALAPDVRFETALEGDDGLIRCALAPSPHGPAPRGEARLVCAGREARAQLDAEGRAELVLRLPRPARWSPATHGAPSLHEARVTLEGREIAVRKLGFRQIAIDRDADGEGFGVVVDGVPIFARGAVWVPPDLLGLRDDPAALRARLERMARAHMNIVRVPGWLGYGSRAFYDLCDELGLMVWQDFAFANLDYPAADEAFRAEAAAEAEDFFAEVGPAPSLVALCGGSEVAQQAAMLGLPSPMWSNALFDELLPDISASRRPDAAYIPHTPWGGELPFTVDKGVSHYYGVSAFRRPLEDAVLARPRFAAEWLGFNHLPARDPPLDEQGVVQPVFGRKIEGDTGAVWWFESVRDHYLRELYGRDPAALRRDDPQGYLEFSRAVTVEAASEVAARLRRHGSPTRGAIGLMLADAFAQGTGWGLLDYEGRPKPIWSALARAFRPVRVILTDEGLNGARITLLNETARTVAARLSLRCLREGETPVARGEREVAIGPRAVLSLAATDLLGGFFDVTYAYRFGPPSHDVVEARLTAADGQEIDDAVLFPLGRGAALREAELSARLIEDEAGWAVAIRARRFAQSARIVCDGWDARDAMIHVSPQAERRVPLDRRSARAARPRGEVRALGCAPARF